MSVSLTVAVGAAVPITTGSSPVTADPMVQVYAVTSGGTGGEETIYVPMPELPLDDYANGELVGRRMIFFLQTQTNPADAVHITLDNNPVNAVYANPNQLGRSQMYSLVIDFVGAMVALVWCGYQWKYDNSITSNNDDSIPAPNSLNFELPPGVADSKAPSITFSAGNATGSGEGGDVTFRAGAGGGNIVMDTLPSVDPGVAGALWLDSGTLKISAG